MCIFWKEGGGRSGAGKVSPIHLHCYSSMGKRPVKYNWFIDVFKQKIREKSAEESPSVSAKTSRLPASQTKESEPTPR